MEKEAGDVIITNTHNVTPKIPGSSNVPHKKSSEHTNTPHTQVTPPLPNDYTPCAVESGHRQPGTLASGIPALSEGFGVGQRKDSGVARQPKDYKLFYHKLVKQTKTE